MGGLISSLGGFRGTVNIIEGESVDSIVIFENGLSLKKLDFTLRCDDFDVLYYDSGAPKEYRSTLTIIENGEEILTKDVSVNHPLRYRGLTFYQSSYGTAAQAGKILIEAKRNNHKSGGEVFAVNPGESFEPGNTGLSVKINRFFSDFVLDKDGHAINQSQQFDNPAVELLVFKNGKPHYRTWVFQKFPSFHGSKKHEYSFIFKGFEGKEYTGLQVARDPGVNVVWTGCVIMIFGIICTFFVSHRQLWVRLSPSADGTAIVIAGTANKNRFAFKKDFEALSERIEKALSSGT
jgi:cytochrome c biogenesis protein